MQVAIYLIYHKDSDKCYVGSTNNERRRKKEHLNMLESGTHHSKYLQNAWNKHGGKAAFGFKVIEEFTIRIPKGLKDKQIKNHVFEKRKPRETYWIENCNSCYNMMKAVDGCFYMDDSLRRKMSKRFSGKNNPNWNKTPSKETRKKMALAKLGRKIPDEVKRKMSEAHIGMEFSKEHRKNLAKVKRTKEWGRRISEAKTGVENSPEHCKNMSVSQSKPVFCDGKLYPSLKVAGTSYQISDVAVRKRCISSNPKWNNWQYAEK